MKLDTTRRSFGCMRGPYVLKMRATLMSIPCWRRESKIRWPLPLAPCAPPGWVLFGSAMVVGEIQAALDGIRRVLCIIETNLAGTEPLVEFGVIGRFLAQRLAGAAEVFKLHRPHRCSADSRMPMRWPSVQVAQHSRACGAFAGGARSYRVRVAHLFWVTPCGSVPCTRIGVWCSTHP